MNPYFERKILDSDPIDLVRLLYQRAIACIKDAREHVANRRIAERAEAIGRAYAAVTELNAAVKPELAPEIGARLQALYGFVLARLLAANFQQADGPLADALGILVTLLEGWDGVAKAVMHEAETAGIRTRLQTRPVVAGAVSAGF
jgi:flagellar protein FliS